MDLEALLAPLDEPGASGYSVAPIPEAGGYRVGRGREGTVVLLTPPDPDPDPPTRLRMLALDPRVRCQLRDTAGEVTEQDQGLVEFRPEDEALLLPFLEVASALVRLLGAAPGPGEVSRGMQLLVRLFEDDRSASGSVVGLWGELLFLHQADDPGALVDAWHASTDDRFDFSAEGTRFEVKTTTRPARVHQFNLAQLLPVDGADVRVVSVMTTVTDAGTSVQELVARLESRLSPTRQMKVHAQVAATLGSSWMTEISKRFDETQAAASVRVLDASAVPRVEPGPAQVLTVDLTVDCSGVEPLST